MSDEADRAARDIEQLIAARLSCVDAAAPAGVSGECEECGETMPRLVGGRCGFCRDGRRPPLSFYDAARPSVGAPPPSSPAAKEIPTVPTQPITPDSQTISVPARGNVLAAIKARAYRDNEPLGRSAAAIIADHLAEAPADQGIVISLAVAPLEDLLSDLKRRLTQAADTAALDAALARADRAEAWLAAISGMLSDQDDRS